MNKEELLEFFTERNAQLNELRKQREAASDKKYHAKHAYRELLSKYSTEHFEYGSTLTAKEIEKQVINPQFKVGYTNEHIEENEKGEFTGASIYVKFEISIPVMDSTVISAMQAKNAEALSWSKREKELDEKIEQLEAERDAVVTDYALKHSKYPVGTRFRFDDGRVFIVQSTQGVITYANEFDIIQSIESVKKSDKKGRGTHGLTGRTSDKRITEILKDNSDVRVLSEADEAWALPTQATIVDIEQLDGAILLVTQSKLYIKITCQYADFEKFVEDFKKNKKGNPLVLKRGSSDILYYRNNSDNRRYVTVCMTFKTKGEAMEMLI